MVVTEVPVVVVETALEVVEHPVKDQAVAQEELTPVVVAVVENQEVVLQIVELPVVMAVMEQQVLLQVVLSLTQVAEVVELIVLALEVPEVLGAEEQEQQVLVRPEQVLLTQVVVVEVLHKHLVQMTAEMVALA
jgi:hypothetical protein